NSFDPVSMDTPELDPAFPPTNVELSIPSAGAKMPAYLMIANGRGPHPTIVMLHGLPGNERNLDIAQSLRRAGFNVLYFNYRGAWGAEGNYRFSHLAADAGAVLGFLRLNAADYRVDQLRLSVLGHSMGGFAALQAGAQDQRLQCVMAMAAANLGERAMLSQQELTGFSEYADSLYMLNGFSGRLAVGDIMSNAERFDLANLGPGLAGKAVLMITGNGDTVVPLAVQQRIAEAYAADPRIKLTALAIAGDHSFSQNRIELQRIIVAYAAQRCR
ncbi:MAG: alpha/beta fold hydrolase, partial [Pseudomonadota bacterium]